MTTAAIRPAAPPLGRPFRTLWTATAFSNIADGVGRTAVPLIATTLTTDPFVIAILGALAFVPWLVFGIPAGVIVDRFDRRRIMALANTLRLGAAVWLGALVASGAISVWTLLVGTLAFGIGETLFENAVNAAVPAIVPRQRFDSANGWLQASQVTIDNFIATPIGGLLFGLSIALPLWVGAIGYLVPIALALLLPSLAVSRQVDEQTDAAASVPVHGARPALRYLWQHRYLRAVVLFTSSVGALLSFAQAPTILYFLEVQHVTPAAIGFVTAGIGLGALVGSFVAAPLVRLLGRGPVLLFANVVVAVSLVAVGLAPDVVTAIASYAVMAFAVSVWNVPWGALRQHLIPAHLFGRALGIIRTVTWGVFPVATLLGGLVARSDLRLPFTSAGALTLIVALSASRLLVRGTPRAYAAADQANSSSAS